MNYQRFCDNRTPLTVRCLPIDDRRGRAALLTVIKLSFHVSAAGEVTLADPAAPVRRGDIRTSGKLWASVKYPSDYVEEKIGSDVIFVGSAMPPADVEQKFHDVSLRIGMRFRAVRVHGPRVFARTVSGLVAPGPSANVGVTPLTYELARGGADGEVKDARNPSGSGYAKKSDTLVGEPAYRLELLTQPGEIAREPAGFGAIDRTWSPRVKYSGTCDDNWRRERAPILPHDFDLRHNSCAHPDLWFEEPLSGTEPIEVVGCTPEQAWRFQLPAYAPLVSSKMRDAEEEIAHATHLDTLLIDSDERRVELSWRVCFPLPRKYERLEAVIVRERDELPESVLEDLRRRVA